MRISDWSSDVCSSDLRLRRPGGGKGGGKIVRLARGLDQPPFGKGGDDLFLMIVIVLVALRVAGNRDHAASGLATGDERAGAAMAEDDVSLVQYGADIVERQALVHFPAFGAIAAVADLRDHPLRQQTLLPEGFNALHQPVEQIGRASWRARVWSDV